MPEGPELKISSELIRPLVLNKTLIDLVFTNNGRYSSEAPVGYSGFFKESIMSLAVVTDVKTKGKFMWWEFSNGWKMFVTYGMTGQFSPQRGKHPAYYLQLASNPNPSHTIDTIYYNDPRHFGTVKFSNDPKEFQEKLDSLGWDPFTGFSDDNFKFIKSSIDNSKSLAQLLMDQSIFCGVGNYIKSEALYLAKLSPKRSGNSLSDQEIYELCHSIMEVMETSYQHQGATISTYATPYGDEGKYSTFFRVYGNKTDPLGNKVIKETLADKRTTHWVPTIQR